MFNKLQQFFISEEFRGAIGKTHIKTQILYKRLFIVVPAVECCIFFFNFSNLCFNNKRFPLLFLYNIPLLWVKF